jgi:hypothetical protein
MSNHLKSIPILFKNLTFNNTTYIQSLNRTFRKQKKIASLYDLNKQIQTIKKIRNF